MVMFFSYAHLDRKICRTLVEQLRRLEQLRLIHIDIDDRLAAGEDWDSALTRKLCGAKIIVILWSAAYAVSRACIAEKEIGLDRVRRGKAVVIPVLLDGTTGWQPDLGRYQALPTGGVPMDGWADLDEAIADAAAGIQARIALDLSEAPHPWVRTARIAAALLIVACGWGARARGVIVDARILAGDEPVSALVKVGSEPAVLAQRGLVRLTVRHAAGGIPVEVVFGGPRRNFVVDLPANRGEVANRDASPQRGQTGSCSTWTSKRNRSASRSTRSKIRVPGSGRRDCEWLGGGAIAPKA
jgi:hypothetical protein